MDTHPPELSLPEAPQDFGFYLDGDSVTGNRDMFERLSPAHDVPVTRTPICLIGDLDAAVTSARAAFEDRRWSGISGADRGAVLRRAGDLIRQSIDQIAWIETLENGKPISQARAEVAGCADMFSFAAGLAQALHGDSHNNGGDAAFSVVTREPIGVVGVITPWNFPFLILCERIPYILASGNSVVAKPSEVTSATTLMLAAIMTRAGLPDGVFNVVTGSGRVIGEALTRHRDVDMLSFTGSTAVGRAVIEASARSNFKKLALELGGKNPHIVFADAGLEDAADGVAFGAAFNTGQCCVSGSRLLVERSIADDFAHMVADKFSKTRIGDPLDPATQIGAITTQAQYRTILDHIARGQQEGATLIGDGTAPDIGGGYYVTPTIFTGVTPDMAIAREEIFGPVLSVMPFDSMDEAIALANDTDYGLAASVWTSDLDTALAVSRRVRAGRFWVNTTLAGGPELPIGGFRRSGWGREAGMQGVEEYTQVKSIHIETGKRTHWIA